MDHRWSSLCSSVLFMIQFIQPENVQQQTDKCIIRFNFGTLLVFLLLHRFLSFENNLRDVKNMLGIIIYCYINFEELRYHVIGISKEQLK